MCEEGPVWAAVSEKDAPVRERVGASPSLVGAVPAAEDDSGASEEGAVEVPEDDGASAFGGEPAEPESMGRCLFCAPDKALANAWSGAVGSESGASGEDAAAVRSGAWANDDCMRTRRR